jgi:hypothetical protein
MNTAMGNCLLMSGMVYAYVKSIGVKSRLANNGDDCVVIMERRDVRRFCSGVREWFLAMGYTMKVENPVDEFEQIEFCQTRPIWTPDGWLMCRDPRVCLSKDLTSVLPMENGNMRYGWATAIGECGMSLCGGVPIMQQFYQSLLTAGGGRRLGAHPALESGFARLATNMHRKLSPVHWQTRYSFWRAFGVTPHEQEAVEEWFVHNPIDLSLGPRDNVNYTFPYTLLT